MERTIHGVKIECVVGDITRQEGFDAIVNAANAQLLTGGGVAGAIHRAAGPGLAAECRPLAPIKPGQAVITGGHNLPNRHVIHCLGPVYGADEPSDLFLVECYRKAFRLAEEHELASMACPAISTGFFGYPIAEAAEIAVGAAVDFAASAKHVRVIRFVLFDEKALRVHEGELVRLAEKV